ncbi:MAG: hypothetical protein AMS16_06215, partial [Planctomycetes bacterium DG_58]
MGIRERIGWMYELLSEAFGRPRERTVTVGLASAAAAAAVMLFSWGSNLSLEAAGPRVATG